MLSFRSNSKFLKLTGLFPLPSVGFGSDPDTTPNGVIGKSAFFKCSLQSDKTLS